MSFFSFGFGYIIISFYMADMDHVHMMWAHEDFLWITKHFKACLPLLFLLLLFIILFNEIIIDIITFNFISSLLFHCFNFYSCISIIVPILSSFFSIIISIITILFILIKL